MALPTAPPPALGPPPSAYFYGGYTYPYASAGRIVAPILALAPPAALPGQPPAVQVQPQAAPVAPSAAAAAVAASATPIHPPIHPVAPPMFPYMHHYQVSICKHRNVPITHVRGGASSAPKSVHLDFYICLELKSLIALVLDSFGA